MVWRCSPCKCASQDRVARAANLLSLKRLRGQAAQTMLDCLSFLFHLAPAAQGLMASPHPSINSRLAGPRSRLAKMHIRDQGQAAEALKGRGVLVGTPATWFFGMEAGRLKISEALKPLATVAETFADLLPAGQGIPQQFPTLMEDSRKNRCQMSLATCRCSARMQAFACLQQELSKAANAGALNHWFGGAPGRVRVF